MLLPFKTFAVNAIDVLGARGACGKPAGLSDDFNSSNRLAVPGSAIEDRFNFFAGQFSQMNLIRF